MTTEQRVANAFRLVALKMEDNIERGRHTKRIDAKDLFLSPHIVRRESGSLRLEHCKVRSGQETD
jgi:predicted metalloprotease